MKKTLALKLSPRRPDVKKIKRAAKAIHEGGLVAFPTETVYGIAANVLDRKAIDRLYRIKGRPKHKPFTIHIADLNIINRMGCDITKDAEALINRYWPGPLTIILKSERGQKIGFRMPANKVALELIRMAKVPVAAPSANLSGKVPPKNASDVLRQLDGRIDILLDAGPVEIGVESTVVDMTARPVKILREGAISRKEIMKAIAHE